MKSAKSFSRRIRKSDIALRPTEEDRAFEKKTGLPAGHWGAREGEARFKGIANGRRPHHEEMYPAYYDADQLYDLQNDPQERANLAGNPEHAAVLRKMRRGLSELLKGVERPFGGFN